MKTEIQKQRHEKWLKLVNEYLASNVTQKTFCEQNNLTLSQFVYYYGLLKYKDNSASIKADFSPVKILDREKPVSVADIKLSLPNGFQCVFPSHIDIIQIKRLVEALLSC